MLTHHQIRDSGLQIYLLIEFLRYIKHKHRLYTNLTNDYKKKS